jgi:hypothetical protein
MVVFSVHDVEEEIKQGIKESWSIEVSPAS